jgi:hypothetical protein
MTGEQLWTTFLQSQVPDEQLVQLGHDLYFARPRPTGIAIQAVAMLAGRLAMKPEFAYQAFNIDPGKPVLEQLASDYEKKIPWASVSTMTSNYINRVAQRVTIIHNASKPPSGGLTQASSPPKKEADQSPAKAVGMKIAMFIVGSFASFLITMIRGLKRQHLKLSVN